ncbi:hypothetical protein [Legionella quinlivanii]|uniref:hypothetical protein n=1 Tax=Legionella quinlivanii TaxID=45073 RepID=UPI0022441385|nr:hypothetical protein [Legionella quinlivanii]MCW8451005.1 hypothetical protein [Legionella quinlivanii]
MKQLEKINKPGNLNLREKIQSFLHLSHPENQKINKWLKQLDSLLASDEDQFNKGFNYFFSTTRKDKVNNYKLEIKIFLRKMAGNNNAETLYSQLLQLKLMLQRVVQEQAVRLARTKAILKLIAAIDHRTDQLRQERTVTPNKQVTQENSASSEKKKHTKKIISQAVFIAQELKSKLLSGKASADKQLRDSRKEALDEALFQTMKMECGRLIKSIQEKNVGGQKDLLMQQYADRQRQLIDGAKSITDISKIKTCLDNVLKSLNSTEFQEICLAILDLRKGARSWFAIGKNAKADRIEDAIRKVSVERRGDMFINNLEVRKALASHRHFGKRGKIYLNKNTQDIDLKKAARTFIEINNRLEKNRENSADVDCKVFEMGRCSSV